MEVKNWQKIKYCPWYVYKGDGYDKEELEKENLGSGNRS